MDNRYLSKEEQEALERGDRSSEFFKVGMRKLLYVGIIRACKAGMSPEERKLFEQNQQQQRDINKQLAMMNQINGGDTSPNFLERLQTATDRQVEDIILQLDNITGGHGQKTTGAFLDAKDGLMSWISKEAEGLSRQFFKK